MKRLGQGTRLVIGKNSVREVLRWASERIVSFVAIKEPTSILGEPIDSGYPWQKTDFDSLTELAKSDGHQGIAVIVREKPKSDLKSCIKMMAAKDKCTVVVLSSIQDPHHLGAIFRASEAFGVDLLIWSTQHSTGITAAVTKVAVGSTELVPYCEVANVNDALRKLKEAGFWVIAAEPGADQHSLASFDFPSRSVIVLGAEGEGIPRLTLQLSDFHVAIEQSGKIDSISLSQAAAIFLYQAVRKNQH